MRCVAVHFPADPIPGGSLCVDAPHSGDDNARGKNRSVQTTAVAPGPGGRPGQGGSSWGGPDLRRSRTAAASGVRSLTPHHRLSADAAPRLLCGHSWFLTPSGDCSSPVLAPSLTVPGKAPYGLCLGEALNPGAATVPRRWDGMIRHLWTPHGETAEKLISLKKGSCKP